MLVRCSSFSATCKEPVSGRGGHMIPSVSNRHLNPTPPNTAPLSAQSAHLVHSRQLRVFGGGRPPAQVHLAKATLAQLSLDYIQGASPNLHLQGSVGSIPGFRKITTVGHTPCSAVKIPHLVRDGRDPSLGSILLLLCLRQCSCGQRGLPPTRLNSRTQSRSPMCTPCACEGQGSRRWICLSLYP